LARFGGIEKYKEAGRDIHGLRWLDAVLMDCRFSARMLLKQRGLTTVGAFSMAVAIAVGATAFESVSAMLGSVQPYPGGERIVGLQFIATDAADGARHAAGGGARGHGCGVVIRHPLICRQPANSLRGRCAPPRVPRSHSRCRHHRLLLPSVVRAIVDLFDTYGVPMVARRRFTAGDIGAATAVIVNRSFADMYLQDGNAVGVRFHYVSEDANAATDSFQIIGVVIGSILSAGAFVAIGLGALRASPLLMAVAVTMGLVALLAALGPARRGRPHSGSRSTPRRRLTRFNVQVQSSTRFGAKMPS
jgi:hypothetical protein